MTALFYYCYIFVLGLILGSYLNSWMWRVHEGKWRFLGRSICVSCSRALSWYENIPLFSFLFLRGRCRTCKTKIPVDYFLVELATGLLFVFNAWYFTLYLNSDPGAWPIFYLPIFLRNLFFSIILLIVFVYDAKYMTVLSGLVYVTLPIVAFWSYAEQNSFTPLLIGAAVGFGFFFLQYAVSRGRWIGGGDVRLGLAIGAMVGYPNILLTLFLSYIFGALVAIPLLLTGKKSANSEIPFGTFLALGTFVTIFWGDKILNWYLGFLK